MRNRPRSSTAARARLATRSAAASAAAPASARTSIMRPRPAGLELAPHAMVAKYQVRGALRPPAAGIVIGEVLGRLLRVVVEDRIDPRPRGLDRIAPHEQRGVAAHRVEQQALIRLGRLAAE